MKFNSTLWAVACLGLAVTAAPVAFAQQQQQDNASQYNGVSHPPADDAIVATPDEPYAPPAAVRAKPSPEVYAPPPPPAQAPMTRASATAYGTTSSASGSSRYDNTDYGIVTRPVTPQQANAAAFDGSTAVLHTRSGYNPDNDIVTRVPDSANALPEGTLIRVRLDKALSTNYTLAQTPFQGRVAVDVLKGGSVIIPAGSILRGRVTQVTQGHHLGTAATLRLRPDMVILPDGTAYHLYAEVIDSDADGTRTGSEGGIKPSAHVAKKSLEYGVGVGTGAMVGAELAGPAGAIAGSLIGAGLVTTHLLTQHPTAANVPAGSEVVFSLTEPMDLTPTRN